MTTGNIEAFKVVKADGGSSGHLAQMLFGVLLPIVIAGAVYYIFFPDVWFVRRIDELTGTGLHLSGGDLFMNRPVYRLLRFYGFDFVWAFSLSNAVRLILGDGKRTRVSAFLTASAAASATEFLQLFQAFPGTFDIWDIAVEIIGAFLATLMIKKQQEDL